MSVTYSGDAATTRTSLGLGDAATKTTGTASGNIPVLDGSGNLDSGTYTNTVATKTSIESLGIDLPAANLTGTINNSRISSLPVSAMAGIGTSGQVLTSTGAGSAPTMQDAAGGGKLLQVYNYSDGTRASTSATETWTTQFSGNFTKLSSTSTIVMATSISSWGEHRSGAHERMQFGSSTSTVKTGSWPHSGAGQQTQTYVITNNTQTGSLAWTFQWHHRPCYIVNPNSSDSGEFTTQTYTNIVFWEVEV